MKTIKLLFLGCFIFLSNQVSAQTDDTPTVVYLKSGEIYKGKMLEYRRGEYIVLKLKSGTVDTIPDSEISRLVQMESGIGDFEMQPVKAKKPKAKKVYRFKEKGWYNVTGFSGYAGAGSESLKMGIGLSSIGGYLFIKEFGLGLGIGKDNYSSRQGEGLYPVFIEVRGYLTKKYVAPYYSVKAGYAFAFTSEKFGITKAEGGLLLSPSIGLRLGGDRTGNIFFELGYKFQKQFIERTADFSTDATIIDAFYRRIVFSTGIIF